MGGHYTGLGPRASPRPGDLRWGPGMGLGRAPLCAPLAGFLCTVPGPEGTRSQMQAVRREGGTKAREGGTP